MITEAFLSVSHPGLLLARAGGLLVIERQLFTAGRAGLATVRVQAPKPAGSMRLPPGLEVLWAAEEAGAPLVLSGQHFVRVDALRSILRTAPSAPTTWVDACGRRVAQVLRPGRNGEEESLPEGAAVYLGAALDQASVLRWLLSLGTKSQDGFMARNFDRRISLSISRLLLDTKVTPNMMTAVSLLFGLCGAAFFLTPGHASRLAGALLIWLHSVLDGCDGELARIRFQESPIGGAIDFWGDNLVHVALFGCLAAGFAKEHQSAMPLFLGLAAAAGTAGSAVLVFKQKTSASPAYAPAKDLDATLTKVGDALAARDFIYLLVFLATIDRLYAFLWASGLGSLLFFAMLSYLSLRRMKRHEEALKPHEPRQGEAGGSAPGNGSRHQHLHSRS